MRSALISPILIGLAGLALAASSASPGGGLFLCHAWAGSRPVVSGDGPAPRILPGFGDAGYDPERANPAARAQFDNGVRLNNAFNEPEAIRAFMAAERLDPACALCFWGEAAARGPTINYPVGPEDARRAVAALDRAASLSAGLSPKAQGIVAAERARYVRRGAGLAEDAPAAARASEALADRFPSDDALQVAAASDRMIAGEAIHDLKRPTDASATAARTRLERVLARSPDFTPALHFYIHLMEWTGEPARAEAAADRLGRLAPAAGHLVHMPSHIYYQVGRYEDAAVANRRAADADAAYVAAVRPPSGLPDFALHAHNLSYGLAGALMSGDAATGLDLARRLQAQYPADSWLSARAYLAVGRYAAPDAVLALPAPKPPLAQAFWRYARGEALARRGDGAGVRAEARAIADLQAHARPAMAKIESEDRAMVDLARLTLEGRAAMLARDWPAASRAYRAAAALRESRDTGRDPPMWGWPPRRSLAAALLAAGDAAGAAREAKAALAVWPGDGVALTVLARAQAQASDPAAPATAAAAARAWRGPPDLLRPELV